jgi:predicted metal-dependent HD superfamily phosphohydrolase
MKQTILETWTNTVNIFENANENIGLDIYNELVLLYSSPDRVFHTFEHIEKMLNTLHTLFSIYSFTEQEKASAIFATFFHDSVYNPSQHDNEYTDEEMSASTAIRALKKMGITEIHVLDDTYRLITLTGIADPGPTNLLDKIFIDANRSVYGIDPHKYLNIMYSIWAEYRNMEFEVFVRLRTDFLSLMLSNNSIFYSEYMKQMFNDQAIDNITTELNLLYKLSAEDLIKKVEGYA